jgi:hypothetical protein
MFSSIITSILRATKSIKIPGGKISIGVNARATKRSPPPRRVIR